MTPKPWRGVVSDTAWLRTPAIIQLCIEASCIGFPHSSDPRSKYMISHESVCVTAIFKIVDDDVDDAAQT